MNITHYRPFGDEDAAAARLRARVRLALERAAFAALTKEEEPMCCGENGMLDTTLVIAWLKEKHPGLALAIETGIVERSTAARAAYRRRRMS